MKKNRTMRIAVVMLALSLITCCFVGSTFAKYTSSVSGNDTVSVAKWHIGYLDKTTVGATEVNFKEATEVTFDLFNTIKEDDGTAEEDVKAGLIAPGTSGSFSMDILNRSEVTAEYDLTFSIVSNDDNIPLLFKVNDGEWKESIADLNLTGVELAMVNGDTVDSDTIVVEWMWAFDNVANDDGYTGQTNATDTALGEAAQDTAPSIEVKVEIVVDQVN